MNDPDAICFGAVVRGCDAQVFLLRSLWPRWSLKGSRQLRGCEKDEPRKEKEQQPSQRVQCIQELGGPGAMGVVNHCEYWFQEQPEVLRTWRAGGFGKRTRKADRCGECVAKGTSSPCASLGLFVFTL